MIYYITAHIISLSCLNISKHLLSVWHLLTGPQLPSGVNHVAQGQAYALEPLFFVPAVVYHPPYPVPVLVPRLPAEHVAAPVLQRQKVGLLWPLGVDKPEVVSASQRNAHNDIPEGRGVFDVKPQLIRPIVPVDKYLVGRVLRGEEGVFDGPVDEELQGGEGVVVVGGGGLQDFVLDFGLEVLDAVVLLGPGEAMAPRTAVDELEGCLFLGVGEEVGEVLEPADGVVLLEDHAIITGYKLIDHYRMEGEQPLMGASLTKEQQLASYIQLFQAYQALTNYASKAYAAYFLIHLLAYLILSLPTLTHITITLQLAALCTPEIIWGASLLCLRPCLVVTDPHLLGHSFNLYILKLGGTWIYAITLAFITLLLLFRNFLRLSVPLIVIDMILMLLAFRDLLKVYNAQRKAVSTLDGIQRKGFYLLPSIVPEQGEEPFEEGEQKAALRGELLFYKKYSKPQRARRETWIQEEDAEYQLYSH